MFEGTAIYRWTPGVCIRATWGSSGSPFSMPKRYLRNRCVKEIVFIGWPDKSGGYLLEMGIRELKRKVLCFFLFSLFAKSIDNIRWVLTFGGNHTCKQC